MADSTPMCWAGKGYPADDKFTVLFHELVEAYQLDREQKQPFEFGVYRGLLRAYILLTGDSETVVEQRVADAAREPVLSS